jgi:hypothetical protein
MALCAAALVEPPPSPTDDDEKLRGRFRAAAAAAAFAIAEPPPAAAALLGAEFRSADGRRADGKIEDGVGRVDALKDCEGCIITFRFCSSVVLFMTVFTVGANGTTEDCEEAPIGRALLDGLVRSGMLGGSCGASDEDTRCALLSCDV